MYARDYADGVVERGGEIVVACLPDGPGAGHIVVSDRSSIALTAERQFSLPLAAGEVAAGATVAEARIRHVSNLGPGEGFVLARRGVPVAEAARLLDGLFRQWHQVAAAPRLYALERTTFLEETSAGDVRYFRRTGDNRFTFMFRNQVAFAEEFANGPDNLAWDVALIRIGRGEKARAQRVLRGYLAASGLLVFCGATFEVNGKRSPASRWQACNFCEGTGLVPRAAREAERQGAEAEEEEGEDNDDA
jgi:hypothetical protein